MLKKILIFILTIALTACASKDNPIQKEYIDPVMDIFLFDEISENEQDLIKKANGNKEYKNFQFKMIGKDTYDKSLTDINGNIVNLNDYDKLILEVVSYGCEHCKKLISNYNDQLLESNVKIIQYFNIGTKEEILDLYNDINVQLPSDIIIVSEDEEFGNYLKNILNLEFYPSLISFVDNKITFNAYGDMQSDELNAFLNIGFENLITNTIDIEQLCNKSRSIEDVQNSLSQDNLNKIKSIDNDENTLDYTLKLIGSKLDFDSISNNKSSVYINEIDSFEEYKDSDLVLIYTYLSNTQDEYKINFINKLIDSNNSVEYIVVLIEGIDSSSDVYNAMPTKFHTKVVSVLGYIPDDFFKIGIKKYPTAFFVEKGTFTGAYSNIDSIENFNNAIDLFIGDNSIALKENN